MVSMLLSKRRCSAMIVRAARPLFLLGVAGMFIVFLSSMFLAVAAFFRDLHRRP